VRVVVVPVPDVVADVVPDAVAFVVVVE